MIYIGSLVCRGEMFSTLSLSIRILVRPAQLQREQSKLGTELGLEVRESMFVSVFVATQLP